MSGRLYTLCYHGVYDRIDDPRQNNSGKHIHQDIFYQHMLRVKEQFSVVSVTDIENEQNSKQLSDDAVLITFDDGYENLFSQATPVLEDLNIPATLFLATGFIGKTELIWTDFLEFFFLNYSNPETTIRQILEQFRISSAFDPARGSLESLRTFKEFMKTLPESQRGKLIAELRATVVVPPDVYRDPLYLFLSWDQVLKMYETGLWSFGSHTQSHVSLGTVDEETGIIEIQTSQKSLHDHLPEQSKRFSYPEGQPADIPIWSHGYLREQNFRSAFSAYGGANALSTFDRLEVKRTMMGFNGQSYFPWGEKAS